MSRRSLISYGPNPTAPMTEQDIIQFLDKTGHLSAPFGEPRTLNKPVKDFKINDREVVEAVQSYQAMFAVNLEPLVAKHHPSRASAAIQVDGKVGPATFELMQTPRCDCKDYEPESVAMAVGSGNWKRCWSIGEFHCAKVNFKNSPPAFLAPVFEQVWNRVVQAYAELGLLFKKAEPGEQANIDINWQKPDGGWIGLAIVGQNQNCGSNIWARFDQGYQPANIVSEWTTLMKHELGHNCGLQHSSGGVMNPYIVKGLPVSWKGDPSYNLLTARFGGQPIPIAPRPRKMVLAWQYGPTEFEVIQEIPTAASGLWPT